MRMALLESDGGALAPNPSGLLVPVTRSADTRPARVYLARLGEGSRRAQEAALNLMARQLTGTHDRQPGRLRHGQEPQRPPALHVEDVTSVQVLDDQVGE
jgi:hypothetical protein